ncbi:peptidoglycan recognition protein family protein [Tsukamurella paurometabola]|uniref:peptidoglycan recognition protein family protein n=1 Tax=Tsukamurella paurometabola TaxID=2061 RepID=UPI001FE0CDB5|nr:peptidoglycan recognition family protein [Tsukamurella paurometabola]
MSVDLTGTQGQRVALRIGLPGGKSVEIAVRRTTHGRDDRPLPNTSELIALPPDTIDLEVITDAGISISPTRYRIATAPNFQAPVATHYGWGFPVVTRSGWGADPALQTWGEPEYTPAQLITVHHTAQPRGDEFIDYRDAIRSIYRFHALPEAEGGRGWGDIGYHLIIDPNGVIYAGRDTGTEAPIFTPGTTSLKPRTSVVTAGHVYQANSGNIGICVIGDFTGSQPTPAARAALTQVLSALCQQLQLNPQAAVQYANPNNAVRATQWAVSGHRDWSKIAGPTECPGDELWALLPALRSATELKIADENRVPRTAPSAPVS